MSASCVGFVITVRVGEGQSEDYVANTLGLSSDAFAQYLVEHLRSKVGDDRRVPLAVTEIERALDCVIGDPQIERESIDELVRSALNGVYRMRLSIEPDCYLWHGRDRALPPV